MCSVLLDSYSTSDGANYLSPYPVASLNVWSLLELLENEHCEGIRKRQDSSKVNIVSLYKRSLNSENGANSLNILKVI